MKRIVHRRRIAPVILTLVLGACRPDTTSLDVPRLPGSAEEASARVSAADEARNSGPDSTIWKAISETDGTVVVGLKEVGSARGMVRGRATISPPSWKAAAHALAREPEMHLVAVDTVRYPVVFLRPTSLQALARIRRLPFVDYVEPNLLKVRWESDGCASGGSGDAQFNAPTLVLPTGDQVAATYGPLGMNVPNAWKLATGLGVTVGMIDTGLGWGDGEFGPEFLAGQSSPRTLHIVQDGNPTCSHGTRIASLATAPMNGLRSVGVAYRANLVSMGQGNAVAPDNGVVSGVLVDSAANAGAKVIIMAFGFPPHTNLGTSFLSDVIDYHHYVGDVLFVGAAGTCPIGNSCPQINTAVFPASKEEVLAVSGAGSDGARPNGMYNYGNKSGILAYTGLATVGLTSGLLSINGSSAATGFVGGAAALVRQRFPGLTARQAMNQLMSTTTGSQCGEAPAWRQSMVNVSAAVGGACVSGLKGPFVHYTNTINSQEYSARVKTAIGYNAPPGGVGGSGSYSAQWTISPEQLVTLTSVGIVSDGTGNTYWQSSKALRFLPAYDGMPYRSTVALTVSDGVFDTHDPRTTSVLVCSSVAVCFETSRTYPGDPPPPPPLSATISGASSVPPSSTCNFFGAGISGTEPYSYEWYVNSVLSSTGSSLSLATPAGGSVIVALKVTDASQATAWASLQLEVDVLATCYDQL